MNYPIEKAVTFEKLTGRVVSSGTFQCPEMQITDTIDVLVGVNAEPNETYVLNGEVVERVVRPSKFHTYDWNIKEWEDLRTLQDFKNAKWLEIKEARSIFEYAGFTWEGSTFDSDSTSQNRITGAVTLAQMSTAFSIDWILANNTVRVLNQIDMLQVGAALGNHVAEQFSKGVTYRTAIDAASTVAEVQAVVWE